MAFFAAFGCGADEAAAVDIDGIWWGVELDDEPTLELWAGGCLAAGASTLGWAGLLGITAMSSSGRSGRLEIPSVMPW